jgi:hypothetical protein
MQFVTVTHMLLLRSCAKKRRIIAHNHNKPSWEMLDWIWGVKGALTGSSIANIALAGQSLIPSFYLAKPLDYIPRASSQSLFPHMITDSFLTLITKVQLSKHQGPAVKILYLATSTHRFNQDSPVHPSTDFSFSLKPVSANICCCLCLVQKQASPNPQLTILG